MIFLNQVESTLASDLVAPGSGDSYHYELDMKYNNTSICDLITGRFEGSTCKFYGAEEIVRAFMQKNNLAVATFMCTINRVYSSGSSTGVSYPILDVLYLNSKLIVSTYITADYVVSNFFLIPYSKIYAIGVTAYTLYYYTSTAGTITITRTFADGTTDTITSTSSAGYGYLVVNRGGCIYAHAELGDRNMDIYFVDAPKVEKFLFRNIFNAQEGVYIPASLESNPKTEFEEAQQEKVLQRYDVEQLLEFSLKAGSLPSGMYKQLHALCRARVVKFAVPETMPSTIDSEREISIIEYKLPKSTEPNTPLTFEMKFKYCDTEMNDAVVLS